MDPFTYLLGTDSIEDSRHFFLKKRFLCSKPRIVNEDGVRGGRVQPPRLAEPAVLIFQGHIDMVHKLLDQIKFPVYREKNYKHPLAKEETIIDGHLTTTCLGLGTVSRGRRKLPKSKVFICTLVCKGTTLCQRNYDHGRTSTRRFCGFGIRIFSRNECPTQVSVECFGKHIVDIKSSYYGNYRLFYHHNSL